MPGVATPTLIQTQSHRAATQVSGNDVSQTVLVTVTKLTTNAPWLDTQLDQYGPAYEFTVTPALPPTGFNNPVLAGMCIAATGDAALDNRLRIAHNNASGPLGPGMRRFGIHARSISGRVPADVSQLGLTCTGRCRCRRACSRAGHVPLCCRNACTLTGTPATSGGRGSGAYSPFAAGRPVACGERQLGGDSPSRGAAGAAV